MVPLDVPMEPGHGLEPLAGLVLHVVQVLGALVVGIGPRRGLGRLVEAGSVDRVVVHVLEGLVLALGLGRGDIGVQSVAVHHD